MDDEESIPSPAVPKTVKAQRRVRDQRSGKEPRGIFTGFRLMACRLIIEDLNKENDRNGDAEIESPRRRKSSEATQVKAGTTISATSGRTDTEAERKESIVGQQHKQGQPE